MEQILWRLIAGEEFRGETWKPLDGICKNLNFHVLVFANFPTWKNTWIKPEIFLFFCALGFKEAKLEDRQYGLVDNEAAVALANGASNLYAFRLHHGHNHHHHLPNLHLGDGFGAHELRLP